MKPEHHQNRDTNDWFTANIQINGMFSVIPRIAAGEITPEGLRLDRWRRSTAYFIES